MLYSFFSGCSIEIKARTWGLIEINEWERG